MSADEPLPPDVPPPVGSRAVPLGSLPVAAALVWEGRCLEVNAALVRLLGCASAGELVGRPLEGSLALDAGVGDARQALAQATRQPVAFEVVARHRNGTGIPLRVQAASTPVGDAMGLLVLLTDLSPEKAVAARLRESEARFRSYVEQSIDVIFTLDAEGTFRFVSPAWERHFGYPTASVVGQPFAPYVHPDDIAPCMEHLLEVFRTGRSLTSPPYRVKLAEGGWRWFRANGGLLTLADGRRDYLGVAHDITEIRQVEQALRDGEARYRTRFNLASEGIMTLALDGRILDVNDAMVQMHGFTREEMLRMRVGDLDTPVHAASMPDRMTRMLAGESLVFELEHVRKDGSTFPLEVSARLLAGEDPPVLLAFHRDISARRAAERAAADQAEQLRVVFETSDAGIILVSPGGRIELANAGMARLFATTVEALAGSAYLDLVHPDELTVGDHRMRQLLQGEVDAVSLDRHYRRKDGSGFWGHLSGRRLAHPDGSLRALVGIITDITARREAEAQQQLLQAQLHQAQKMESLGHLAGGVAHDMNNVLGAILGLASAQAEAHAEGTPTHRAFSTIIQAAERGGGLLKGLLSFARQGDTERQPVDLNALLREEVHLLERTTLARVALALDLAEALPPVLGDAGALSHAVMNLCVNAVDAMEGGGTLTLRTRDEGQGWVLLEVEDTGSGMSPEVLERALDPFFTTKAMGKGTGLGLSIVYRTVESHGGRLSLHSQPGRGTRIALRFPALPAAVPRERGAGPLSEVPATRPLRVLLVDDDELIQASMQGILEGLGHQATILPSGEAALGLLDTGFQPDVVILDMNMPGLGGAGTLPGLRRRLPAVPILLATGRADQTAHDLVAAHPGVVLLPKPFGLRELAAQLNRLAGP